MPITTDIMREQVEYALQSVLWNANNHPVPSAVLGREIWPLVEKCAAAVLPIVEDAYQRGYDDGEASAIPEYDDDPYYCCPDCDGY